MTEPGRPHVPEDRRSSGPSVVALTDPEATDPALVGGKGANLARLVDAGVPVPEGFCVTTVAYRALADAADVRRAIDPLEALDPTDVDRIAELSGAARDRIRNATLPDAVRRAIEDALDDIDADAFAVRSSATAEDLPTASFAGQHETFLAVRGGQAVLDRVRDCMASLFTERAVTYRLRNGIPHSSVGMAVVVQEMVEPEVAGVLFTADPVSGNRYVASIDASFGLGDAVVAGEVSPDNARVDRRTGEVIEYEVGEKARAIRSRVDARGGTETVQVPRNERSTRALTDEQVRRLVGLGERAEALLGAPQDVEWALVDGEFVLLQSRPITSLYPLPSPPPDDGSLHVYLSVGHQQAMPEALPPLVVDFWRGFLDATAARFRPGTATPWAVEAGGRVYVDLTPLLRLAPLRRALPRGVSALSEPASEGLAELLERRRGDLPPRGRLGSLVAIARAVRRARPFPRRVLPRVAVRFARAVLVGPPDLEETWAWTRSWGEELADAVDRPDTTTGRVRAAFTEFDLGVLLAEALPWMVALPAGLLASEALRRLFPDMDGEIDALGKGFEDEVVTRMNRELGELADLARDRPAVVAALEAGASLPEIEDVEGGEAFVDAFGSFLTEFGHRATGELDLSRPRWRDDPEPLLRTVRSAVARGERGAHREHLRNLQRGAAAAANLLEARADRGPFGRFRWVLVRHLVAVYRAGIPVREFPKQGFAHLFAAVHDVLSEAGETLAADGRLDSADDVWYLRRDELLDALDGRPIDVDVGSRRRTHERHAALTAPPLLTSEGERPSGTRKTDLPEGTLAGTPVSAGRVEGVARVIRDPSAESLESGEILVAPSTDPGWTPLFLNAAGLVMEVGGRMTHGALVAREYGIPAVASVSRATTTIRTGDRIRVDGTRGVVELLE